MPRIKDKQLELMSCSSEWKRVTWVVGVVYRRNLKYVADIKYVFAVWGYAARVRETIFGPRFFLENLYVPCSNFAKCPNFPPCYCFPPLLSTTSSAHWKSENQLCWVWVPKMAEFGRCCGPSRGLFITPHAITVNIICLKLSRRFTIPKPMYYVTPDLLDFSALF